MRLKVATLLAGAFLFLTVPAFATPNFCGSASGTGPTDIGTSLSVGGITFTGWSGTSTVAQNTQINLSCKNESVSESGLGLVNDGDGEINGSSFVQLDISALNVSSLTLEIQSLQAGENFVIVGSDSNGVFGTDALLSGTGTGSDVIKTVTFNTNGHAFIDVSGGGLAGTGKNILINQTPEPSTYLLMGTGLLMLGLLMRRKFASVSL